MRLMANIGRKPKPLEAIKRLYQLQNIVFREHGKFFYSDKAKFTGSIVNL